MDKILGRVLRGDEVKLEGRVQLNVTQAGRVEGRQTRGEGQKKARIVENHPEFAVIEITCCCGAQTYLRCEYAQTEDKEKETDER